MTKVKEFFNKVLFTAGKTPVTVGKALFVVALIVVGALWYKKSKSTSKK